MKGVPSYRIGTEIETILSAKPCQYDVTSCYICETCTPCDYCDRHEIREYIINNYDINEEELDDNRVCELCERDEIWRDVICVACDPCERCEDQLPPFLEGLEKYIERFYEDGSCGLEISTIPFSSIKEYYESVKQIVEAIGPESIKIKEKCGGHINISWIYDNGKVTYEWYDYEREIVYNLTYFADLLTYMCCSKYTKHRAAFKYIAKYYDDIYTTSSDKYHCIHTKSYAVEIRYPDSPKSPFDHLLLSVVNLSLSFITQQIKDYKKEYEMIYTIYSKVNFDGEKLSSKEKRYLKNKFKLLIKSIKPYIKIFSRQLNIDLQKALETRIQYPRYEYGQKIKGKIRFSEELFKIKKPKTFESSNHPNQISLCMF